MAADLSDDSCWTSDGDSDCWGSDSSPDEQNSLLTNWDLNSVLIAGAQMAPPSNPAPEPKPPKFQGCRELFTITSWLFTPLFFLIVGLFFISTAVTSSKLTCSWPLWIYYLLVGISNVWLCVTACMFAVVYKIRDNCRPLLDVHSKDIEELLQKANPNKQEHIDYLFYQELVGQLNKLNRHKLVTAALLHSQFRMFDQYKGKVVPIAEVKNVIKKLSRISTLQKVMHASLVASLSLFLVAVVYGTAFALSPNRSRCDSSLVSNLEHSLLMVWVVLGVLSFASVLFFNTIFARPPKPGEPLPQISARIVGQLKFRVSV